LEDAADFVIFLDFKFKAIDANGFAVEEGVVFVYALIRVSYKVQAVFKIYTLDIFTYGLLSVMHVGDGEQNSSLFNVSGWVGSMVGWDVCGKYCPHRYSIPGRSV
jgi:hypothetical protein